MVVIFNEILYCIVYYMLRYHISDSVDVMFHSVKWPCQQRHSDAYRYNGEKHKDMNKIAQLHAAKSLLGEDT